MPKVGIEDRKGVVSQADSSKVDEDDINLPIPPMESVNQVPDVEAGFSDSTGTSEHLIPDDVNLPSQYLVTQSDDSSDMEDTTTTELNVDSQVNEPNTEDDLPFIDSKIDSLVDTNEFLEFVDTLDDGEQTSAIEPKSVTESQFSSVMSYHEGDSTPLRDPSTDSQELSKSLDEESTEELASHMILMCLPQILKSLVHNQPKMILLFKILTLFNQKMMSLRMLYLLKLLNLGGLVEKENRQLCMVTHCCTLLPAS